MREEDFEPAGDGEHVWVSVDSPAAMIYVLLAPGSSPDEFTIVRLPDIPYPTLRNWQLRVREHHYVSPVT